MKTRRFFFLLFLGVFSAAAFTSMTSQVVHAQTCTDPATGAPIPCPSRKKKPTLIPPSATATPTLAATADVAVAVPFFATATPRVSIGEPAHHGGPFSCLECHGGTFNFPPTQLAPDAPLPGSHFAGLGLLIGLLLVGGVHGFKQFRGGGTRYHEDWEDSLPDQLELAKTPLGKGDSDKNGHRNR